MADQAPNNKIKPKNIMDRLKCSLDDAFNYIDIIESNEWAKSELLSLENENQGSLILEYKGAQIAEDMRNQDRWNKVLLICDAIDSYSISAAIEILNRCISREIQNAIDKQYPIA